MANALAASHPPSASLSGSLRFKRLPILEMEKMTHSGHGGQVPNTLRANGLSSRRKTPPVISSDAPFATAILTSRQAEVLHWIAEGKTNGEIATILGCSAETVKNHVKQIFQRLGVHSRTAAAAYAYRQIIAEAERLRSATPPPVQPKAKRRRSPER